MGGDRASWIRRESRKKIREISTRKGDILGKGDRIVGRRGMKRNYSKH